jgi:hypothetical protein
MMSRPRESAAHPADRLAAAPLRRIGAPPKYWMFA